MVDNPIHNPVKGKNGKIYALGGVAAIAIVFVAYKREKSKTAAAVAAPVDTSTTGSTTDPSLDSSYGSSDYSAASGSGTYGVTPSQYGYGSTATTAPANNAQWAQQVESILSQEGYSEIAVAAAVGHYLSGAGLSNTELSIVQAGMAQVGNPPAGAPQPHLLPTTSGASKPPPFQGTQAYVIKKGDTWAAIAKHHYGSASYGPMLESHNKQGAIPKVGSTIGLPPIK